MKILLTLIFLSSLLLSNTNDTNNLEKDKYFQRQVNKIINKEYIIKNLVEELLLKTGGYGLFTNTNNIPYQNCKTGNNIIGNATFNNLCSLNVHEDYYKSLKDSNGLNWINGSLNPNKTYKFNNDLLINYLFNNNTNNTNPYLFKENEILQYNHLNEKDVISIEYLPKTNSLYIYNSLCKNDCNLIPSQIENKWKYDKKRGLEGVEIKTTGSVVKFDLNFLIIPTIEQMNECLKKDTNAIPLFNIDMYSITKTIDGKSQETLELKTNIFNETYTPNKNDFSICVSTLNGSIINIIGKELLTKEHYSLSFKTYGKELLSISRELTNDGLLPYLNTDNNIYAVDINGNVINDNNGKPIFAGKYISSNPQINYENKSGINTNINKYQTLLLSSINNFDNNEEIINVTNRNPLYGNTNYTIEKNKSIVNGLTHEVIQVPFLFTLYSDSNPNISEETYEDFKEEFFKSNFTIIPKKIVSRGRCETTKIVNTNYFKPCNINKDCATGDKCIGAGQVGLIRKYVLEDKTNFKIVSNLYTSNLSVPCVNSPSLKISGTNIGPMNGSICELSKPTYNSKKVCTYNSTYPKLIEKLKDTINYSGFTFILKRFEDQKSGEFKDNFNIRNTLEDFISNNSLNEGKDISSQQYGFANIESNETMLEYIDKQLEDTSFISYHKNVDIDTQVDDTNISAWPYTQVGEIGFDRDTYNNTGLDIKHVFLVKDSVSNVNDLSDLVAVFYNQGPKTFLYYDAQKRIRDFNFTDEEIIGELYFSKTSGDFFAKQVNTELSRCSNSLKKCSSNNDCDTLNGETCDLVNNKINLNFIRDWYGVELTNDTEIQDCRTAGGIVSDLEKTNQILPLKMEHNVIINNLYGIKDVKSID